MTSPIALTDIQLREIRAAAQMVPLDLRTTYLERLALELRDKDLTNADGFVHRTAYAVARQLTWDAGRVAVEI